MLKGRFEGRFAGTFEVVFAPADGGGSPPVPFDSGLLFNGSMELDSGWASEGAPSVNERSTEQVYQGTYSRKYTTTGDYQGIKSDPFSTTTGKSYTVSGAAYGAGSIIAWQGVGDGSNNLFTGIGAPGVWTPFSHTYVEANGGAGARMFFLAANGVTMYVDAVKVVENDQNLMIWSEEFDNALGWGTLSGVTVTPNDALSPIGDMTADKLVAIVAGGNYIVQTPVPCLALTEYTFSVYMRAAGNESIGLYAHGNQDSIPEAHPLVAVTAAWQRFSLTFTTGPLETSVYLGIGAYGQFSGQTIWAWGAQLNAGPTATIYTKTTASPVP